LSESSGLSLQLYPERSLLFGKLLVVIHLLALAGVAISGMSWPLGILLMLMASESWQFHQWEMVARFRNEAV
jgi:hypothetical protein